MPVSRLLPPFPHDPELPGHASAHIDTVLVSSSFLKKFRDSFGLNSNIISMHFKDIKPKNSVKMNSKTNTGRLRCYFSLLLLAVFLFPYQNASACDSESLAQDVSIESVTCRDGNPGQIFYMNNSGPSNYSDFTNPAIPYDVGIIGIHLNIQLSSAGNFFGIWVDENDNGIFEANENPNPFMATNPLAGDGINHSFWQPAPGCHLMRLIVSTTPILDPCADIANGEVEDYTICFPCSPASQDDNIWISNVRLFSLPGGLVYENPSGPSNYSDFTNPCIPVTGQSNTLNLSFSQPNQFFAVYIDVDGDGNFTVPNEVFAQGPAGGSGISLGLGGIAAGLEGEHLMRIIFSSTPVIGPCEDIQDGEIEDYTLCFPCSPASQDDNIWITNVRLFSLPGGLVFTNPSGPSNYSDYTNLCIPVTGQSNTLNLSFSHPDQFFAVYVDANGNGIFEDPNELLAQGQAGGLGTSIGLGGIVAGLEGEHRMRIIFSDAPVEGPCDNVANGEVEEYTLCFPCTPVSQSQNIWIKNVRLYSLPFGLMYKNPSGPSPYSDFTDPCIPAGGASASLTLTFSSPNQFYAIYIDYNGDGLFDGVNELLVIGQTGNGTGFSVGINSLPYSLIGEHQMRIIYSSEPVQGPCENILDGEIEDYTLCFDEFGGGGIGSPGEGDGNGKTGAATAFQEFAIELDLYPQPAQDHVNIQFSLPEATSLNLRITDLNGQVIAQPLTEAYYTGGEHQLQLPVSQLAKGIYLVRLRTATGSITKKLIVM